MFAIAILLVLISCVACGNATAQEKSSDASTDQPMPILQKLDNRYLPNLIQVLPQVLSGGLPDGEAAFRELADLGIKTIISVDGMKPDIETAGRFGLKYIHLPHGYDGISEARGKELAKAIRELPGPFYIHCHHGKHRSPTAAAVACVVAGMIPPDQAESILTLAGTSPHYRGLYRVARKVRPVPGSELDALQIEFKEVAEVPPMAEAMIEIERIFANLELISKAKWNTPPQHPDLVPAHEVLLLRQIYAELLRAGLDTTQDFANDLVSHNDFRKWLQEGEQSLSEMEKRLGEGAANTDRPLDLERLDQLHGMVQANCQGCHYQFRDQPDGD